MTNVKKYAFEYLLFQLLKWNKELSNANDSSSFTRLKALKLLFFTAAVKNGDDKDLLDIFDNFYAMQNGPVESDIYNLIICDQLDCFSFKNFSFNIKKEFNKDNDNLNIDIKKRIEEAVNALRNRNESIVTYNAERLVSISHMWSSWQNSIQIARALGKGSYRMDNTMIRNNPQIFEI